jgi:hypothetical protein
MIINVLILTAIWLIVRFTYEWKILDAGVNARFKLHQLFYYNLCIEARQRNYTTNAVYSRAVCRGIGHMIIPCDKIYNYKGYNDRYFIKRRNKINFNWFEKAYLRREYLV